MYNIDYKFAAEYCKANWPAEVKNTLKIADNVSNNTFLFNMPWDMERTVTPTHFDGEIDWKLKVNGDNEYMFQMNRHRYFINLGQAYCLTGDKKYAKTVKRLMTDWINKNPCPFKSGDHPWRSLETGLRGEYWTKAIALVKDCSIIDDAFLKMYQTSLDEHAKMLVKCHDSHKMLSNWGVIQDHGLFAIGIELGNQEYIDIALGRLYSQANLQVMRDGFHWEQSCLYHNEVLNCFLDVIIRANSVGIKLSDAFLAVVKKMAMVNIAVIKPNKKQPLFGDSDYTDLRDILSQTALIFNDGQLKSLAYDKLDYESAWLFGKKGVIDFDKITASLPDFKSISLSDSGNYIMRSGWDENASHLIMHNGYTGGGHAHEDKLSFDLSLGGKDILTDCGRYTYMWGKDRKYLKSYHAHNTASVDGRHFLKSFGWGFLKLAPAMKQDMTINNDFELITGTHMGYYKAVNPVITTRKILWIKPDVYIIIDEFKSYGRHKYNQYFNFSPEGKLQKTNNRYEFTNGNSKAVLCFLTQNISTEVFEGIFSEHYNKKEKNTGIKTSFKACGNSCAITVIVANNNEKYKNIFVEKEPVTSVKENKEIKKSAAGGIKIKLDNEEFTVILIFDELMKSLKCGGKLAAGKITYYCGDEFHIVEW